VGKGRGNAAQIQGANAGLTQRQQLLAAVCRRCPDAQAVVEAVGFVNPAVAVFVKTGQFGETVVGARAEQFAAVVDTAVIIAIQRQIAAARRQYGNLVFGAIEIEIEAEPFAGQLGGRAREVDHQRILQGAAGAQFKLAFLIEGPAQTQIDGQIKLAAIGGLYLGRGAELQLFLFLVGFVIAVNQAERRRRLGCERILAGGNS
jgi:hypothetical protein